MTRKDSWYQNGPWLEGPPHIEGILPKGSYPPCLRMAERALWQDTLDIRKSNVEKTRMKLKHHDPVIALSNPHELWSRVRPNHHKPEITVNELSTTGGKLAKLTIKLCHFCQAQAEELVHWPQIKRFVKLINTLTKWQTFFSRYFQMHFLVRKKYDLIQISLSFVSKSLFNDTPTLIWIPVGLKQAPNHCLNQW